jgi:hypothetical protein
MSNTRRRTFKSSRKLADYDPLEFEINDQTFKCKPALQGAVLLEFVAKADSEEGGAAAGAMYDFFGDVMDELEYKRFRNYLKNPDIIIEMETIGEIAAWLVEEYTARPTEPSSSSDDGPSNSGPTSTDRAS